MNLQAEPLTVGGFAPFGDVIEAGVGKSFEINEGFTTRFHALATAQSDANIILSIFRGRPRPQQISMLERHPAGSQAFMPLACRDWLVVVAEVPEPGACRLFRCRGDQGVQYARGTWHHPLLVLEQQQDFLVVDRAGEGPNLEEVHFSQSVSLLP